MVDKNAKKEARIRHYKNYEALLKNSKVVNNAEMARLTGTYASLFTDWAKGRYEPKIDKIFAIAKILKVNPNKIID